MNYIKWRYIMKREIIFFVEFVSLIILIIGYKLLVYVLKNNNYINYR